jgi:hypothetical protein
MSRRLLRLRSKINIRVTTNQITPKNVVEGKKKTIEITGKGHDVILEIVNPMKHRTALTVALGGHVPENGGTCKFTFLHVTSDKAVQSLKKYFLLQNMA